jgi:hypothetical protein
MKAYQVTVGSVAVFTGPFAEALPVIAAGVEKPRFDVSKSAIESADVGSKFRVTSRVKGVTSKATLTVVEVEEPKTKAPKTKAPAGLRKVSWDYIVSQVGDQPVTEVSVRKATERRFELKVNGKVVWYSFTAEVANAAKEAVETNLMAKSA